MANTFSQIYLQYVFAVKHRQASIPRQQKDKLDKYFARLVQIRKAKMLEIKLGYIKHWVSLSVVSVLVSCAHSPQQPSDAFKRTWYAGKAELSSYNLQQARYGEIRNGEAAIIFVTEDFSIKKLVKLDDPEKSSKKVRVLKMNMTKKFFTGIYPYSMMLSVFTPVSKNGDAKTLKADCSSQEWCGHTFSKLGLNGNNYTWNLHSYFEKEGEQIKKLDDVLLEDELWNRIRINPSQLPQGKVSLIPGLFWQRLSHAPIREEEAILSLSPDTINKKDDSAQLYTIHYPGAKRTLQIFFQAVFPYEILGWQETYPDGGRNNNGMLTTKAFRKKKLWIDYWKHNANADSLYRDSLQLLRYD